MASKGICDRVAIVGMGCTSFGEHWNRSLDDLLIEAAESAQKSAGIDSEQVDAYWLGTMGNLSGLTLSEPLKIDYKPVTHVENYCATGSEALRNAAYAVASGAYDVAMAIGGEKLKDSGHSGLSIQAGVLSPDDGARVQTTTPAMFSRIFPVYARRYGVPHETLRQVRFSQAHSVIGEWLTLKGDRKSALAHFKISADLGMVVAMDEVKERREVIPPDTMIEFSLARARLKESAP